MLSPSPLSTPSFDLLTDLMEQVRLESTAYFHVELRAPWGMRIARKGRSPFYVLTSGECHLSVEGVSLTVRAGDFVLLPHGAPHIARSEPRARLVDFDEVLQSRPFDEQGRAVWGGAGVETRVTGGFFSGGSLRFNPLFAALPAVIHLRADDPGVQHWLGPVLRFIEAELERPAQGSGTVLRRLADVLFIQAVRAVLQARPEDASGWLRGLSDPRIARALALIHERYAEPWTMESLAREAGLSRTALAVRFKALVGEPPMSYLERWRITRAATALRETELPIGRVAQAVGYASDPVFSKAFKRVTGSPPGRYRRQST